MQRQTEIVEVSGLFVRYDEGEVLGISLSLCENQISMGAGFTRGFYGDQRRSLIAKYDQEGN